MACFDILPKHVKQHICRLLEAPSLVSMTLLSKAWAEIALDALYASVDDFAILLQPFLPSIILDTSNKLPMRFLQTPTPSSCASVWRNCNRVKSLRYYHGVSEINRLIELDVFTTLKTLTNAHSILPNLSNLDLASRSLEGFEAGIDTSLLNPTLRSLKLDLRCTSEDVQDSDNYPSLVEGLLNHIARDVPHLSSLAIKVPTFNRSDPLIVMLTSVVTKWTQLRNLVTTIGGPESPRVLRYLATQSITTLDLTILTDNINIERLLFGPHAFRSLQSFKINSSIVIVASIFANIRSSKLHSIEVRCKENCPLSVDSLERLVTTISTATRVMRWFSLQTDAPSGFRSASTTANGKLIFPLLSQSGLEELSIHVGMPIAITDNDIETMALVWSSMVSLYIGTQSYNCIPGWRPCITYSGLMMLLSNMSKLESLSLELDCSDLDRVAGAVHVATQLDQFTDEKQELAEVKTSQLQNLDVGNSIVGSPLTMACFLAQLCPRLSTLEWSPNAPATDWFRVRSIFQTLRWLEGQPSIKRDDGKQYR